MIIAKPEHLLVIPENFGRRVWVTTLDDIVAINVQWEETSSGEDYLAVIVNLRDGNSIPTSDTIHEFMKKLPTENAEALSAQIEQMMKTAREEREKSSIIPPPIDLD